MDPIPLTPAPAPAAAAPAAAQPSGSPSPAQPAATAPPKPGDSPTPAPPAGDPADKRVTDAQARMHEATEEAAQRGRELEATRTENHALRASLASLVTRPEFQIVEEPAAPGDLAPDKVQAIWDEYSKAPDDAAAFGILLRKAVALSKESLTGEQQHEQARKANQQRVGGLIRAVHEQISTQVTAQAPDIKLPVFWGTYAPLAQRETPTHLTHPIDRWEFQMRRAIELYRQDFPVTAPPTPDPTADPHTTRRPATAVMPAGSLHPRGGDSAARPRTMAEQTAALQERIMPGAARRAG